MNNLSFLNLFFSALMIWSIYLFVEILRRLKVIHGELGRKTIHIGIGVFMAATPIFMNRTEIIILNWAILVGLLILGRYHVFDAYEDVDRWSIGQYLYPLAIIFSAFVFDDALIFSFVALELAFADGFAAIFGSKFGIKRYHIFGGDKSFLGSTVFFLVSLVLLTTYATLSTTPLASIALIPMFALVLTVSEALFAGGFDNLVIPIITGVALQYL